MTSLPEGFDSSAKPTRGRNLLGEEFVAVTLPLFMTKSGEPIQVGFATVTKNEDTKTTEIKAELTSEEAQEFGSLLTSGIVGGLSIGGFIHRNVTAGLN